MIVVSFMNMKGGVGKTTLAVNICYGLAHFHAKKVLLVDVDPQFNATQSLVEDDDYLEHWNDHSKGTLVDIFSPRQPLHFRTVKSTKRTVKKHDKSLSDFLISIVPAGDDGGRFDLLPSTIELVGMEYLKRGAEKRLRTFLHKKASHYDYVIIDCPPTISLFTAAALWASSKYVVPIKPNPLSTIGLPLLERWIEEYCEDEGHEVQQAGFILTMIRGPTPPKMRDAINQFRADREGEVFVTGLSDSDAVASAVLDHKPIFLFKPRSKSAKEITKITEEFLARVDG